MIIFVLIFAFIIWWYKRSNQQLQSFMSVTAYAVKSNYDYGRRKQVGGSYRTTVRYVYAGQTHEERLQYNTKKMHPDEPIDCLVNHNKPTIIYPANAQQINGRMIAMSWAFIGIFVLLTILQSARFLMIMM